MEIDSETHRKAFESLASELLDQFSTVESVRLFGSVSRGEQGVNSDVDVLIRVSDLSETDEIEQKAFSKSTEFGVSITPVIVEEGKTTQITEKAEKEGIEYVSG